ncbi:ATP-binding protein [Akkermansiaceae bacterium]|nr:ATP-binding protein [Akkermansiaceae bacterium]
MSAEVLSFQVSPRLAEILGEGYSSTELALKELVDNAWDADSTEVRITVPAPMTADPIVISDNGSGMKTGELRQEYFMVARDRRLSKGEKTAKYGRKVKGRKGIGKFAGLMLADSMELQTTAGGNTSTIKIRRTDILAHHGDFENFPVTLSTEDADATAHGTTVRLSDFHQQLQFPNADKLREHLIREYGKADNFVIYVNDQALTYNDIPGEKFEHTVALPSGGTATVRVTVAEGKRKLPQKGLVVRINGKTCGKANFFGLEDDEVLPRKLIERCIGEIEIESNDENLVTADWGGLIESNLDTVALTEVIPDFLRRDLERARTVEVSTAKARYQKLLNQRLEKLPAFRRDFARRRLARVFEMFFHENEERFEAIIGVVLDTFDKDEYWVIIDKLSCARDSHVGDLAETLIEFGLVDTGIIGRQARARIAVLEELQTLINDNNTREDTIHRILESNMWIFEFAGRLISSNEAIKTIVERYLDGVYQGTRASKRPDLLAAGIFTGRHLIVELKRPSLFINRDHERQALEYKDDLQPQLQKIEILIIGKGRDPGIDPRNERDGIEVLSYTELISQAHARHEWLIRDLRSEQ